MPLKKQNLFLFALSIILVSLSLSACGEEATPTTVTSPVQVTGPALAISAGNTVTTKISTATTGSPTVGPSGTGAPTSAAVPAGLGLTMQGAYTVAEPAIRAWQADALLISIFNPPDSPVGLDAQGQAPQWFFEAFSPVTARRSFWLVKSEEGSKFVAGKTTEDQLPTSRTQLLESRKLPPIISLIDTGRLLQVARENGGSRSDRPLGIQLARSGVEGEPLAFDLVFYMGENVIRLRVDAQSGKLLENVKG